MPARPALPPQLILSNQPSLCVLLALDAHPTAQQQRCHAAADLGHQLMAELLAGVVLTAVKNVAEAAAEGKQGIAAAAGARGAAAVTGGTAQPVELPPPMIPGNADVPTCLCAMQVRHFVQAQLLLSSLAVQLARKARACSPPIRTPPTLPPTIHCPAVQEDFKGVARRMKGFEYNAERPKKKSFVEQKWGYTANEPGAAPVRLPVGVVILAGCALPAPALAAHTQPASLAVRWLAKSLLASLPGPARRSMD